jgi:hypothetical protein
MQRHRTKNHIRTVPVSGDYREAGNHRRKPVWARFVSGRAAAAISTLAAVTARATWVPCSAVAAGITTVTALPASSVSALASIAASSTGAT